MIRSRSPRQNKERKKDTYSGDRRCSPSSLTLSNKYDASDHEVEKFFQEEKLLMEKMHEDKTKFLKHPEYHPDYDQEWEKFYTSKCYQFGPMHPSYLQEDWASAWKQFFFNKHETLVRQERNMLLNKHRLFYSDLKNYQERKERFSKNGSSMTQEQNDCNNDSESDVEICYIPTKSKANKDTKLSTQTPSINIASYTNSSNPDSVVSKVDEMSSVHNQPPVIQTLRLLSAIEEDLDYVGPEINRFLMQINTIDVDHSLEDNSISIIKDYRFLNCLKSSKAILSKKLSNTNIQLSENKTKAYHKTIEHINQLLETNNSLAILKKKEDQIGVNYEEMIKSKIEKKVVEEFRKAGRQLNQDEKDSLVAAEVKRILPKLRQEIAMPQLGSKNCFSKSKNTSAMYSQSSGASNSRVPTQTIGSYENASTSNRNGSLVNSINWEELQKVVNNITKNSSNLGSQEYNAQKSSNRPSNQVSNKNCVHVETIDDDVILLEETDQKDDIVCLDDISFEDLTSLCSNVKKLDPKTQTDLIQYMKNLEKWNPIKVEKLKKRLNIL